MGFTPLVDMPDNEVDEIFGTPFICNQRRVSINMRYFAAIIARERQICYAHRLKCFMKYNPEFGV